jgi:hypothetical protein
MDPGLRAVAGRLGAGVVELSVDGSDVDLLNRQAASRPALLTSAQRGKCWQDAGYWLVPLIALISTVLALRGWKVRSRIWGVKTDMGGLGPPWFWGLCPSLSTTGQRSAPAAGLPCG